MVKNDMSMYKELFLAEAKEHLQSLNNSLLAIEQNPDEIEHLNEMFRAAHTLKGMASTMGYTNISELAHKMENVLGCLRSIERIDKKNIDILFECIDTLELLIDAVASGKYIEEKKQNKLFDRELTKLNKKLGHVLDESDIKEKPSNIPEIDPQEFTESKKRKIKVSVGTGSDCFNISILLSDSCLLKSARTMVVLKELEKISKIIKTFPNAKDIENGKIGTLVDVVITTKKDPKELKELIEKIGEIEEVEVSTVALPHVDDDINENEKKGKNEKNYDKEDTKIVPTIRVNIKRLQKLQNLVEELAIAKLRLLQTASKYELSELNEISASIDRLTSELQERVFEMRLFPVDYLFSKFPRLVRDLGKRSKKEIDLIIEGSEIELDRLVLDEIDAAVLHLLRNSVDHGIEKPDLRRKIGKDDKGKIILAAKREGNFVNIEVSDDGKGLDLDAIKSSAVNQKIITKAEVSKLSEMEVYELLGTPGLSTSEKITDVSGRGVGFNVVRSKIKSLGGNVKIESTKGKGTKIELRLPLTTAIIRSLLIEVESEKFALPLESVKQIIPINEKELKSINQKEVFNYRGQVLPLLRLKNVLNIPNSFDNRGNPNNQDSLKINPGIGPIVVLEKNEKTFGLMVDSLLGQQETVVKPLSGIVQDRKEFAGATILGDGTVALIIDVGGLI